MKKIFKWIGIVIGFLIIIGIVLYAIYLRPIMQRMGTTQLIKYDDNLTLILGGGGNTGILSSDSLVLVVDTKMNEAAEELHTVVKQIDGSKAILVVNTHVHSDHSKGNSLYKGDKILAGGNYTKEDWKKEAGEETMPTEWVKDSLTIKLGNETVSIINLGRDVHTKSDIVVYLHKRKMLFGGDVILSKQVPALLKKNSPDPKGYLYAFDMLQKRYDIKHVVPGHGDIGGQEIIDDFRQYFKDMYKAAQDDAKEDELVAKYKDWVQVPFIMSPSATVNYIRDNK